MAYRAIDELIILFEQSPSELSTWATRRRRLASSLPSEPLALFHFLSAYWSWRQQSAATQHRVRDPGVQGWPCVVVSRIDPTRHWMNSFRSCCKTEVTQYRMTRTRLRYPASQGSARLAGYCKQPVSRVDFHDLWKEMVPAAKLRCPGEVHFRRHSPAMISGRAKV
jgi:hypothetical protein